MDALSGGSIRLSGRVADMVAAAFSARSGGTAVTGLAAYVGSAKTKSSGAEVAAELAAAAQVEYGAGVAVACGLAMATTGCGFVVAEMGAAGAGVAGTAALEALCSRTSTLLPSGTSSYSCACCR